MCATVLIVDDDRGMRLTLSRILAHEGYSVLVADGGVSALSVGGRNAFDLALVDYRMTGANGGDVCAALSRLRPEAAIYMMTAHVSPEAAQSAVANGAAGILYKPLDLRALLALLADRAPAGAAAGGVT